MKNETYSLNITKIEGIFELNTIAFRLIKARKDNVSRILQENQQNSDVYISNIKNKTNELFKKFVKSNGSIIFYHWNDDENLATYLATKKPGFDDYKEYIKNSERESYSYPQIDSILSDNNGQVFGQSIFSKEIMGNETEFQFLLGNNNEELSLKTVIVGSSLNEEEFNFNLYLHFKGYNINIYDKNDEAFVDPCYTNDNLDYDITQEYRRKYIYQGELVSTVPGCSFVDYNSNNNIVIFNCSKNSDTTQLQYHSERESKLLYSKVKNIPTKCSTGGVIRKNIAFWLYLVLFLLFILFDVLLFIAAGYFVKNQILESYMKNDRLETQVQKSGVKQNSEEIQIKDINVGVSRSFAEILGENFLSLHPICSLFRNSLIYSKVIVVSVFISTMFNLFGFNALYFNETMIEDRIYDDHRANFGYPMKTEFEKIMSSIVTTMCFTVIVKLICLTTIEQKKSLGQAMSFAKSNEGKNETIINFNSKNLVRRIIAIVFMVICGLFFYYYTVVFCGVYPNTQIGWFYSGIWSLFMNWVVFAPFYIIVISIIEGFDNGGACSYYMKQLFVF